jgi:hypothetical protein
MGTIQELKEKNILKTQITTKCKYQQTKKG